MAWCCYLVNGNKLPSNLSGSKWTPGDRLRVKIANNMYTYDASSVPVLPFDKSHKTRRNCFKLSNQRFYHDVRKYSFIPRIINIWNSLPDLVVNVDSINIFKSRLDKYWINQVYRYVFYVLRYLLTRYTDRRVYEFDTRTDRQQLTTAPRAGSSTVNTTSSCSVLIGWSASQSCACSYQSLSRHVTSPPL